MIHTPEYQAALAHVRKLNKDVKALRKQDKEAQKFIRKADRLTGEGMAPAALEALRLLTDDSLEWSSDFQAINFELAKLIRYASAYPSLKPIVVELCEKLLYSDEE
jgi:hypothetical protein